MDDETLALRLMLTAGLAVAAFGALVSLLLYAVVRTSRDRLFPPAGPVRPVHGAAVIGAFAVFVLVGSAVQSALVAQRFFPRVYGPEFPGGWPESAAHTVRALWSATIAFPIQVGLIVGLAVALGSNPITGRAGPETWWPAISPGCRSPQSPSRCSCWQIWCIPGAPEAAQLGTRPKKPSTPSSPGTVFPSSATWARPPPV